jgi:hypothetical protein
VTRNKSKAKQWLTRKKSKHSAPWQPCKGSYPTRAGQPRAKHAGYIYAPLALICSTRTVAKIKG